MAKRPRTAGSITFRGDAAHHFFSGLVENSKKPPTPWQIGYPKKPGWYVVEYSRDTPTYEAMRLVEGSAIFQTANPEAFGIKRHFEFSISPALSEDV